VVRGVALTPENPDVYAAGMHLDPSSETPKLRPFTLATRGPQFDPREYAEARQVADEEARRWALSIGIDTSITTVAGTTNCEKQCTVRIDTGGPKNPDHKMETGTDTVIDDTWDGPPQG
jgi:hypothetical protein